jgi:serine/threonine-protein kinase RsbT
MARPRVERIRIAVEDDVLNTRLAARVMARDIGFSLVLQTKASTAASELARNTLDYGGGGEAKLEIVSDGNRDGLRMEFHDEGPGIADIDQAMQDGFSSQRGHLGLGLGGARRLSSDFDIQSELGKGTRICIALWP